MTTIDDLDDFAALDSFFRIVEEGLAGIADGEHSFDRLAEDVVVDYVITTSGYPGTSRAARPWPSVTAPTAP